MDQIIDWCPGVTDINEDRVVYGNAEKDNDSKTLELVKGCTTEWSCLKPR